MSVLSHLVLFFGFYLGLSLPYFSDPSALSLLNLELSLLTLISPDPILDLLSCFSKLLSSPLLPELPAILPRQCLCLTFPHLEMEQKV